LKKNTYQQDDKRKIAKETLALQTQGQMSAQRLLKKGKNFIALGRLLVAEKKGKGRETRKSLTRGGNKKKQLERD